MARSVRSPSLETRTSRLKLKIKRKPYYVVVARGIRLGYRRNQGAGTWNVQAADGHGGTWLKAFATADDFEETDGEHVLTFWQAQDHARSLARATEGNTYRPATVSEALDSYEADLRAGDRDVTNARRVRKHLPAALASKAVSLLTARELRQWVHKLATKIERASVNRTAKVFKAALNLAAKDDPRITNAAAWRTGLARLPESERARNVVLPDETNHRLIAGAYEIDRTFGAFVETLAVGGMRTSQAMGLTVGDLIDGADGPRLMVPNSRKGRRRQIERKPIPITPALAAMLREIAADRPGDEPLILLSVHPGRAFARLVARIGLDPSTTLYALRHSNITRMLLAGVPVRTVAAMHDTSVAMIEKTYARYITDHSDALIRRALLQPELPPAGNVVVPFKG